ncbi:MAG: hypothetical protein QOF77_25 [Solirubrobacteraceae bacterium]|jgi:hypothetical protein|nr:hypothetical protein [Solirubrobacteraceae bacterium]
MPGTDPEQNVVPPSEQRGGTTPDAREAAEKGNWGGEADQGIVPADLGGSDAPREMLPEDPELGSGALGATTGNDEPATEDGIDLSAGDNADATSQGGPDVADERDEPSQRDAATTHTHSDPPASN